MIAFAAAIYQSDTSVASQLIVGAVSLISIILTAYTAFATLDDKWHWKRNELGEEFNAFVSGSRNNDEDIPT